ncbi:unnamed protein product [Owenia fusiformis]|uniref:Uncharacterized protein n=1 Tax=Owenia fusiformis TaxID=6347 RepID=A0A8J1U1L1_OWEFU|nr:unnamed protein product [Owenia fusiformis]
MHLSWISAIVAVCCTFLQVSSRPFNPQKYLASLFGGRFYRRSVLSNYGRRDITKIKPECSTRFDRYIYGKDDEPIDPCHFYECVNKLYVRKQCPNGRRTSQHFRDKWEWSEGQTNYPCTVISRPGDKCSLTMSQKGLGHNGAKMCPIDLVFAVHVSCSIAAENKEKIKFFIKHAIAMLTLGPKFTQVGLLSYTKRVHNVLHLKSFTSKGKLLRTVSQMNIDVEDSECGTATWLALKNAREKQFTELNGDRPDKQNVMIVISDGETNPTAMHEDTIQEARRNHEAGIKSVVIALPVTSQQGLSSLKEWMEISTGENGENIFFMKSYDILKTKISSIIKRACRLA